MRLTKEDAKVLNKIVENTTIAELLEEATIQAGHMAYILAQENKHDISVGSHRIAKDIAVNLGIICLLMDIASRDMRSCEDTISKPHYTEIIRVTQRLLQIVGCDIVMEIASKTVT